MVCRAAVKRLMSARILSSVLTDDRLLSPVLDGSPLLEPGEEFGGGVAGGGAAEVEHHVGDIGGVEPPERAVDVDPGGEPAKADFELMGWTPVDDDGGTVLRVSRVADDAAGVAVAVEDPGERE